MSLTATIGAVVPEWNTADRLRKARETTGLSQAEFAAEIGLNRRTIGRYEAGLGEPTKSALLLWQMRTGVVVDWILTGCTPRDLNPEPTDYGFGAAVTRLPVRHDLLAVAA